MSTRVSSLVVVLLSMTHAMAQTVLPSGGDPLLIGGSAMDLPSLQGLGFRRVAITLPVISANADNSYMDAGSLRELVMNERLSQAALDRMVQGDGDVAYLGLDAQVQAIGIGFNFLRADSTPWLSVGLEHHERQLTTLEVDQELTRMLYYGNRQYAGQTVTFDPIALRNITFRSLGGNVAFDLPIKGSDWHLRPAFGLYYLQALEGAQFQGNDISMFTSADGRYVDIIADYRLDVAFPDDIDPVQPNAGKGMALDLAVGGVWKDRLQVHLGVNDIGSIAMKNGVTNYVHTGTSRYDGVDVDLGNESGDPSVTWDTLVNPFDPVETNEAFKMRLPTTLLVYAQYGFHMTKVKGMAFPKHMVWGNLREALTEDHFSRSRMGGAVGYTYNINDRFNAGTAFTLPGGGNFLVGLHATVRMGPVRLGLSSRDVMWALAPNTSVSADARFCLQLAF